MAAGEQPCGMARVHDQCLVLTHLTEVLHNQPKLEKKTINVVSLSWSCSPHPLVFLEPDSFHSLIDELVLKRNDITIISKNGVHVSRSRANQVTGIIVFNTL